MIPRILGYVIPLSPMVAGLALSVWRFRSHDPHGGLACALAGTVITAIVIVRVYTSPSVTK